MRALERPPERIGIWLLAAIGLAAIYAPPLYLLAVSFNQGMQPALPGLGDLSFRWYRALAGESRLIASLWESALVALVTSVITLILAFSAALAYMELRAWRAGWFLFVILPMLVPGVIQGLSLSVIFTRLEVTPFWGTVVAGHVLWALPFAFTVLLTSLGVVKRSYLMAAADLGASWPRQIRDVVLPLVRPGLIGAFLFSFLLSFNEFDRAFYLVGRRNTLPIAMFGQMSSGASPTIYALSGTILLVSIVCVAVVMVAATRRRRPQSFGRARSPQLTRASITRAQARTP